MSDRIEFKTLVEEDGTDSGDSSTTSKRPGTLSTIPSEQPVRPSIVTGEVTPLKEESKRQFLTTRAEGLRTIILLFVVISFGITVALAIEIVVGESQLPAHGGVASNSEVCSDLGILQLKKGGSAVDAAITVMLCNTVYQPQSGGLGGGGVMIIHDLIRNKTVVLDFREVAPLKLSSEKVKTQPATNNFLRNGGLSVGVPGEVKGMYEAHKLYGKLPWASLFAPVIKLAEDGFKVNKKLAGDLLRRKDETDDELFSNFRKVFYKDGFPFREGDTIVRKDLANVMRKLSKEGPGAIYNGSLSSEIVSAVNDAGGDMTLEDLSSYSVMRREPLVGSFNGYEILTVPAPFSGSLLLFMLNNFEATKTESLSLDYFDEMELSLKTAFSCREKLGDPFDFPEVFENEKRIANKSFLKEQRYCDDSATNREDHGTAHVSVIDKDELIVSSTTSLNLWFGSLVVTKSGIVLNNEMADFAHPSQKEAKFNQVGPRRRPLSSMVPTIVHHKDKPCFQRISIGGINGTRITSSVAQTLNNLLSFGMTAKEAVISQKMYCTETDCELEGGFPNVNDIVSFMKQKGTDVRINSKKLALIGLVTKKNAEVDSYADETLNAKGLKY